MPVRIPIRVVVVHVTALAVARCIGWCGCKSGGQAEDQRHGYQNGHLHAGYLLVGSDGEARRSEEHFHAVSESELELIG